MTAKTATSNTRKVVGSLGVLAAAAAVAGLGTFGTFTDSTTPVTSTVATGTLSLSATQQSTLPLDVSGFVPGDSLTRPINLHNDGDVAFSGIQLHTTDATPTVLTSDATNGLQLSVRSCDVAWAESGDTYTCASAEAPVGSGPILDTIYLAAAASPAVGETTFLAYTVSLPTTADNTFQGESAALSLTFSGTQRNSTTH
ncbi:TasA family protein [Blastococcus sp. HT6-30]|uniref:TasA family protein n=1 Tax=Blastococcus sp. HT6-30 TaxID=3144843 RepID=UPI00321BB08B